MLSAPGSAEGVFARRIEDGAWVAAPAAAVRNRGTGDRKAAMERRKAPAFSMRGRGKTEDWCAARRSILSAFSEGSTSPAPCAEGQEEGPANGAGTTAYPAPQRIRAAERWLAAPK